MAMKASSAMKASPGRESFFGWGSGVVPIPDEESVFGKSLRVGSHSWPHPAMPNYIYVYSYIESERERGRTHSNRGEITKQKARRTNHGRKVLHEDSSGGMIEEESFRRIAWRSKSCRVTMKS